MHKEKLPPPPREPLFYVGEGVKVTKERHSSVTKERHSFHAGDRSKGYYYSAPRNVIWDWAHQCYEPKDTLS